jgi:hypothetical protein
MKCPYCGKALSHVLADRIPISDPRETSTRPEGGPFSKEILDVVAIACPDCQKVIGIIQD